MGPLVSETAEYVSVIVVDVVPVMVTLEAGLTGPVANNYETE